MTATVPNLSSQYNPFETESKWQQYWEENQVFKADPEQAGDPYCVVIPPPNVTGSLHMGHAFENALIDVLVRYHRMQGRNTLWLPGTDHASIAVSSILDRELNAQGKSRADADVDRDAYLDRAWQWKTESGGTIVGQLRKLGVSVDWTRERFTMDAGLSQAVLTAFNQLYDEGLIYRGSYMVNWCPASLSAVSDVEVEQKEVEGHLWHFRYPLTDGSGHVEVATTRPETMLGDTAVAVNPDDNRYQHMIGKTVRLPIMEREIPIVADDYVDATFGTGCVKITPAHDPNDFEMGKRHNLPLINVMNKDGSMNENAGPFMGMDRFEARKAVVDRLRDDGCLVKIEDYTHTVPYSDRGKVPIEPLISTQWFVNIRPLADRALDALDSHNSPQFVPERWTKVYRDWLVNLRDWCISRQLWWGHQIPAWYAVSETDGEITDNTPFVVATNEAEAREKAEEKFGVWVELKQDPDVLDTWFSSGLWPFSTMGWPDKSAADFRKYYPTTTLVTGFDIIFFWVARMTMMAGHFTQTMPFDTVYIHGMVRDENNQKMSKTKGNGIDPLVLIDKYGTDALRYTLIREVAGAGQDIRIEYDRKTDESQSVEAAGKFANKLWNASRFVMMNLGGQTPQALGDPDWGALELCDRWILSRFNRVVQTVTSQIDHYGVGEAAKELYEFIWGDFCDWYIELVKSRLQGDEPASKRVAQQTLAYVLEGILKLLHPFMPHITEEVWHTLTQTGDEVCLAVQSYPTLQADLISDDLEQQFTLLIGTVRTIRNLRAEAGIKPSAAIATILQSDSAKERQILEATKVYVTDLAKVNDLTITASLEANEPAQVEPQPTASSVSGTSQDIVETLIAVIERPLDHFNGYFSKTQRPLRTVLIIVAGWIVLQVLAATVNTLESVPILPSLLKLVGLGYSAWFIRQNLWQANQRRQTWRQVNQIWQQVVGQSPSRPTPSSPGQIQSTPSVESPSATPLATPTATIFPANPEPPKMIAGVIGTVQVLIPLTGVVDVDALKAKLEKDLGKVEGEIKSLSGRLSNSGFVDKAPAEVVQGARDALAEAEKQAEILRDRLAML